MFEYAWLCDDLNYSRIVYNQLGLPSSFRECLGKVSDYVKLVSCAPFTIIVLLHQIQLFMPLCIHCLFKLMSVFFFFP